MVNARVAVVTGANKGIGYHIAQSLVHSGLFSVVVLGCRDSTRGQHAAAEIGGCAEFMPLEVGNAASADNFAEALVAKHGRCDVLVNNAGITRDRPLHKMDKDQWGAVIGTNLNGLFNMCRGVIDGMRERRLLGESLLRARQPGLALLRAGAGASAAAAAALQAALASHEVLGRRGAAPSHRRWPTDEA